MSTQRKRTRAEDSEEEFIEDTQAGPSQRVKPSLELNEYEREEHQRRVKDLVRYILSCEYKRKTIRREDLSKIANDKRTFSLVLLEARQTLREVFGFELVSLPAVKVNQSSTQQQNTQSHLEALLKSKVSSANGYVLVSIIKEEYRTPQIIERSSEEYKLTGVLYVILGLIFLGGQSLTSNELYGHLDHLKITKNRSEFKDREKLLDSFIKNNYLRKAQSNDFEGDEIVYVYSWGPRAIVELGHAGIVEFLTSFYNVSQEQKSDLQRKMWGQAGYTFRD